MLQFPNNPRIAVIGAGAMGCYYGGRLAHHGQDVHFLLRSDFDAVARDGLHVQSPLGDFQLPPAQLNIYRRPEQMPKADLILVTLKTTANPHYQELIAPLLHEHTCILTLQNGLGNEQQLADLFGEQRILGGLAFVCLNRISPGHILHTDYGLIKIGEFNRPPTPRLKALQDLFLKSNVKCELLDDLAMGRWEKLIWNVPFNGVGAALGLTTDRLLAKPEGVELIRGLMQEVLATAHAAGVNLAPALIDHNIQRTLSMGPYRSSMQIDQELGRPIEYQSIVGEPLRIARTLGVPTPKMSMLYHLLVIIANNIA